MYFFLKNLFPRSNKKKVIMYVYINKIKNPSLSLLFRGEGGGAGGSDLPDKQ